jgi:hypothetical protein
MRPKMIALGIAGVLAVAIGATASASGGGGPLGFLGGDPKEQRAQYAKDLAGELGIDADRVEKAIESVEQKRRDAFESEQAKALADKLDVSEADSKKALEAGFAAMRNHAVPPKPPARGRLPDDPFVKAVADSLNKDAADVRKALRDIARDKLESKLDEAVKSGRLSKEQADRIRKRIESGNGEFGFRMHGRGHGPGGPGHGPGGPGPGMAWGPPPGPPPGG